MTSEVETIQKSITDLTQSYSYFLKEIDLTKAASEKLIASKKSNNLSKSKIKTMYIATEEKIRGLIRFAQEKDSEFFIISDKIINIENPIENNKLCNNLNVVSIQRVSAQKTLLDLHMLIRSLHESVHTVEITINSDRTYYRIGVAGGSAVLLLLATIGFVAKYS